MAVGMRRGRAVVISGGDGGVLRVWDLETGWPSGSWPGDQKRVAAVAAGALDDRPVTVSGGAYDETVRVWKLATGTPRGRPSAATKAGSGQWFRVMVDTS